MTQCGCDAHRRDPLSDLAVTVEGFTMAYLALHELAHEVCDGRWLVLGGGGYDPGSAVPRAWTQQLAVCSGEALDPAKALPEEWRVESSRVSGGPAPKVLGDGDGPTNWRPWTRGKATLTTRWTALSRRPAARSCRCMGSIRLSIADPRPEAALAGGGRAISGWDQGPHRS